MTLRLLFRDRRAGGGEPQGLRGIATLGTVDVHSDGEDAARFEAGVLLLGWAFRTSGNLPCDHLGEEEAASLRKEGAGWAARHLWGNYLLAWLGADDVVTIFRSPLTGPALYYTADGTCAFTHSDLGRSAGARLRGLDAPAIDAQLRYPLLRGAATGIAGVSELLAGEAVELGPLPRAASHWSPWDHVRTPPHSADPDTLRRTVMNVVAAWSKCFGRIQLELSGGLDSSIVAACLARTGANWRGASLVTPRPDGDERVYAQAVAGHLGIALAEVMASAEPADPLAPLGRSRVRPGGFGLIGDSDRKLLRAAESFGADAIFTGVGGDNIFGYLTSAAPVVDALRFEGVGAALRAASGLGRLTNTNIAEALLFTARRILRPPPPWPSDARYLTDRMKDEPRHPWFAGAKGASDGQRAYVSMLMRILPFLDGYDRAMQVPMIAPLLSQPLVEYGLGVPVWQWSQGGHDRSLARHAFRDDLPPLVLQRRTKGRLESLFVPAYNENRARIGAFLCDGLLAAHGVIDCDAVRTAASRPASVLDTAYVRILQLADMERWARSVAGGAETDQPGAGRQDAGRQDAG